MKCCAAIGVKKLLAGLFGNYYKKQVFCLKFDLFIATYETRYPKAALTLQKDREELLAFYDYQQLIGKA